jgi:glycosyltransferase involved in cell wall biosynthesis
MRVSLIIPCYNHRDFVIEALESALNQTWPDTEIILIDDGSTDGSQTVIQSYLNDHQPKNLIWIPHMQNQGLAATLNEGIQRATGDYISGLASDDRLLPDGITVRVAYLQAHPDKWAVFADCNVIDKHGRVLFDSGIEGYYRNRGMRKHQLQHDAFIPVNIILNWAVPGPVFMGHRRLYDELGFYDETLGIEDWDMYLRLIAHNKLGFLDAPVASYRIHGENTILKDTRHLNRMIHATAVKHLPHLTGRNLMALQLVLAQVRLQERFYPLPVHWLLSPAKRVLKWSLAAAITRELKAEQPPLVLTPKP